MPDGELKILEGVEMGMAALGGFFSGSFFSG
jgi:hypothetical protein